MTAMPPITIQGAPTRSKPFLSEERAASRILDSAMFLELAGTSLDLHPLRSDICNALLANRIPRTGPKPHVYEGGQSRDAFGNSLL
jgi:hypothetical protein